MSLQGVILREIATALIEDDSPYIDEGFISYVITSYI